MKIEENGVFTYEKETKITKAEGGGLVLISCGGAERQKVAFPQKVSKNTKSVVSGSSQLACVS
jgi:hypothetical protein